MSTRWRAGWPVSRLRSAARAAKMPARLVQAAASINRAKSMMTARKGRAGPPSMSPMKARLDQPRGQMPSFMAGYSRANWWATVIKSSKACLWSHPGLSIPMTN